MNDITFKSEHISDEEVTFMMKLDTFPYFNVRKGLPCQEPQMEAARQAMRAWGASLGLILEDLQDMTVDHGRYIVVWAKWQR